MTAETKIKEVINDLRPYLFIDGGDIEFIEYKESILYIKLTGNCENCLMQDETLNNGLKKLIQEKVPEVKEIINVTL